MYSKARPSTLNNYWEHMETLKNMKSLILKKRLTEEEEEEEERRTKQSLDSPQTIEANNKYTVFMFTASNISHFERTRRALSPMLLHQMLL